MPLLVSPMDGQTPMQPIKRDGIEIDRCPVSGGVWLDKGELEKLMAAVQTAASEERSHFAEYMHEQPRKTVPQGRYHNDDDYDDYHKRKYGKKSKMKSLFDLFD